MLHIWGTMQSSLHTYILPIFTTIQWGKCHYYCHFTDEKTEMRNNLLRLFKTGLWALSKDVLISEVGVLITILWDSNEKLGAKLLKSTFWFFFFFLFWEFTNNAVCQVQREGPLGHHIIRLYRRFNQLISLSVIHLVAPCILGVDDVQALRRV